jgi:hypothetical protein
MTPAIPVTPATPTTTLLEPSFLDLITTIEQAKDLLEQTRRHWVCSLRQVAKWLDRPAAVVPARWQAVQISVGQLHHARIGVTPKTLANHKANVRAALRWFGKEHDVPRSVRLRPDWARFYDGLDKRVWERLSSFARYAPPGASAPQRSTTKSLLRIGATAPKRRGWQPTTLRSALWCAPGIPGRLQPMPGP